MRAKRIIEPGVRRVRRRKRERGYTVLAVMIGIAIVSVALMSQAMLAGVGVVASRQARNEFACRVAALAVLNHPTPATDGGSLPPSSPEEGWSDTVYLDPDTGEILTDDPEVAGGGTRVARQWRRGADTGGRTVLEVSATAVDATGQPLAGSLAASAVLSERVR